MKQLELTFICVRQIGTNEWLEFKDKIAAGRFYSSRQKKIYKKVINIQLKKKRNIYVEFVLY